MSSPSPLDGLSQSLWLTAQAQSAAFSAISDQRYAAALALAPANQWTPNGPVGVENGNSVKSGSISLGTYFSNGNPPSF